MSIAGPSTLSRLGGGSRTLSPSGHRRSGVSTPRAIAPGLASPDPADLTLEPELTVTVTEELVEQGGTWLHAVYDNIIWTGADDQTGNDTASEDLPAGFAFSVERNDTVTNTQMVLVARFDPEDPVPEGRLDWQEVITSTDYKTEQYTEADNSDGYFQNLSDHWHIYSKPAHWIAASLLDEQGGPSGVFLVEFLLTSEPRVVRKDRGVVWRLDGDDDYTDTGDLRHPTNDLFLVKDPYTTADDTGTHDGVSIGIKRSADSATPRAGHLIIRADANFSRSFGEDEPIAPETVEFTDVTGPSKVWTHANGASAIQAEDYDSAGSESFMVLAPEVLDPTQSSDVLRILADQDWAYLESELAVEHSEFDGTAEFSGETNISMATQVPLGSGWWALAYKVVDTTSAGGGDDYGTIVLDIRGGGPSGPLYQRYQDIQNANRPHLMYHKPWLILCWDDREPGGAMLRPGPRVLPTGYGAKVRIIKVAFLSPPAA